jgi:hypothetical protein
VDYSYSLEECEKTASSKPSWHCKRAAFQAGFEAFLGSGTGSPTTPELNKYYFLKHSLFYYLTWNRF